ncbi:MAG: hypothetical protein GY774_01390 [Planctomycetes bacterium]|nr:hypothetical protein [Planctomycetota bacterium]
MSPKETPQVPEESQQAAFDKPKEEVCEAQQRRGQYIAHVNNTEPPGRGQYVAGVDNTETLEGIESIESEPTTP